MIVINPRVDRLPADLIERFKSIEPASVGHMIEFGFCDPQLHPLWRPCKVVGPAVTVRTTALDSTIVHVAIDATVLGDVLLIDRNGDDRHACWGGLTSLAAQLRGVAGVIVDGCVTDYTEIEEMRFPVYGRTITALTTKGLALEGEINVPIQIGGVTVHPGDLVVADSDGILILTPEMAAQVVDEAEARQKRGLWVRDELLKGTRISDLTKAADKIRARMEAEAG